MTRRFTFYLALMLAAAGAFVLGCQCQYPADPEHAHILLISPAADEWVLDPSLAVLDADIKALHHISRGLMKLSPELDVVTDTAQSYEFSENHKSVTFTILSAIRWSDGAPLTAAHFRDGLVRSLNEGRSASPLIRTFIQHLPAECERAGNWDNCVRVAGNKLTVTFRMSADLALSFFTQPFTFPQRLDVMHQRREKPYLSPKAYPTIGLYAIDDHQKTQLTLKPFNPDLVPLTLTRAPRMEAAVKRDFQRGRWHIIEPAPLQALSDSFWHKYLRAYPDFNVLALVGFLRGSERALSDVVYVPTVRQYILDKGLPLAETPALLSPMFEICSPDSIRVIVEDESRFFESPLQLFGPYNIFAFLAAESIQKQLLRHKIQKMAYVPLPEESLHTHITYRHIAHNMYVFRSRIPSLIPLFETFASDGRSAAQSSAALFYDYLFQQYLSSTPDNRPAALNEILRHLCADTKLLMPLISIPQYALIHPRLRLYRRGGAGFFEVFTPRK